MSITTQQNWSVVDESMSPRSDSRLWNVSFSTVRVVEGVFGVVVGGTAYFSKLKLESDSFTVIDCLGEIDLP
jgi:hypothetical protein